MKKKILIKEIAIYQKKGDKKKEVSEYIIYVMVGDTKIEAYTEIGQDSKINRLNELILTHFNIDFFKSEESIEEYNMNNIKLN